MKKLVFLCVALLVSPALAVVEFAGTNNGDGTITISYNCTEGEEPRGMALLLTCASGMEITGMTTDSVDEAYNCFIDYAYSNDPYAVGDGDPFADPTGPGVGTLPAPEISICMGVLDETGNQGAGPGVAQVIELTVSGAADLTVAADTLRGPDSGVVGSELASNLPIVIPGIIDDCMKTSNPGFTAWESYGKPDCWCYAAQCNGDIDGLPELGGTVNVFMNDLNVFVPNFGSLQTTEPGVCADLDHMTELGGTVNIFMNDLNIFVPNFGSLQPDCDMTHYNFWIAP